MPSPGVTIITGLDDETVKGPELPKPRMSRKSYAQQRQKSVTEEAPPSPAPVATTRIIKKRIIFGSPRKAAELLRFSHPDSLTQSSSHSLIEPLTYQKRPPGSKKMSADFKKALPPKPIKLHQEIGKICL